MFESPERLKQDIAAMLETLRSIGEGRYACIVEPRGIAFESPQQPEDGESRTLRQLVEERRAALFRLPGSLENGTEMEDVFEGWEHDELFLAFVNGRVAVVLACAEAEALRETAREPLQALADRLLRFNAAWRIDQRGHGFFFGRARLDIVVVGRAQ
jgi:hypothetical protein